MVCFGSWFERDKAHHTAAAAGGGGHLVSAVRKEGEMNANPQCLIQPGSPAHGMMLPIFRGRSSLLLLNLLEKFPQTGGIPG